MSVTREELGRFFDELLTPGTYEDYGPNGLQIEGRERIERIAFAVSATRHSAEVAVAQRADALVVHHGLFWNFHGVRALVGPFGRRVLPLARHEINLFAYHLPLDGHAEIGNAACIARALQLGELLPFGKHKGASIGIQGRFEEAVTAGQLRVRLEKLLNHAVILSSEDESATVRTLGIITGGAHSGWKEASEAGLDAFLTGEISEHDWHDAKEAGVHMYAGGHHATETFGIQMLMGKVVERFGIDCFYIDSENPA